MDQLYSFIDVVALEPVRGHFAAGAALAIFSLDLEDVIWTNGPGAQQLGFSGIDAAIGATNPLPAVARRQVSNLSSYPEIGRDRPVAVRLSGLLSTELTRLLASAIALPDGERALLVAFPQDEAENCADPLQRAISGFGTDGQLVAMLDDAGRILAATDGFERAGLGTAALSDLARSAAASETGVAKRHLQARGGAALPAGMARLSDDPARFFLIAIGSVDAFEPEPPEQAPAEETQDPQRTTAPVRFVYRTDTEGRFSALSPEFLQTVGLAEEAVIGRAFRDVAAALGFDGEEIARLLERRDTWSGRSVLWPLGASGRAVPVDLAALPIYDRERRFEGFRGFGVARLADATAIARQQALAAGDGDDEFVDAPISDDEVFHDPHLDALEAEQASADEADDPFQGEPPALALPEQEAEDEKVVRLAAHRQALAERAALSTSERTAFREIGNRLKAAEEARAIAEAARLAEAAAQAEDTATPEGEVPVPPASPDEETEVAAVVLEQEQPAAAENTIKQPQPPEPLAEPDDEEDEDLIARAAIESGSARRSAPASVQRVPETWLPDSTESSAETPVEPEAPELIADPVAPSLDGGASAEEIAAALPLLPVEVIETAPADAETTPFVGIEPLETDAPLSVEDEQTTSEPVVADQPEPEAAPSADLELIDALPIALIIHAGDRLDFANREFFALTGYASLEAVAAAGGLEALFVSPVGEEPSPDDRCLFVRSRDGAEIAVHAHLQSVPWDGGKSLMLTLRRAELPLIAPEPEPEPEAPSNVTRLPFVAAEPETAPDNEAELARTRALLEEMRAIVDTATDGVILITPEANVRSISRPAEALFGVESASVEGKPFISLFAIESQRSIKDYLTGLTDNGVASVLNDGREVIGRESQGRFIPLFMTIGRLPGDGGFCAVVREITQWKRAEEELTQARAQAERSSSQKSEFLARVSHEIRTPLNAIIGFSELMMEERFGPIGNERYRDYLRDINRSGNHVLELVNDLLDISKIEAGEQELSYVAVSLNDALAEAVAIMQPQANRERVIIRSSFASRLPDVVADLRSVRQIALNLLSNAVRYTQAGGQVIVSTVYEHSGEVILRIRDTGVGMSSAEIDQALRPFKQVNALKRARGDGTGLGLPLTKAMVEANRARFVINSRPGEGTLVEITFPSTRVLAD